MKYPLTEIQLTVVRYAAAGMGGKESAQRMGLSPHTVNTYRKMILKKLDARTMTEAVAKAMRAGVIQ